MSEHCQKHKYDLHWSDITCPYCMIEQQQSQLRTLVEALEALRATPHCVSFPSYKRAVELIVTAALKEMEVQGD